MWSKRARVPLVMRVGCLGRSVIASPVRENVAASQLTPLQSQNLTRIRESGAIFSNYPYNSDKAAVP